MERGTTAREWHQAWQQPLTEFVPVFDHKPGMRVPANRNQICFCAERRNEPG